jgi:hypothetical protein
MFQTKIVEKIKTLIFYSITFLEYRDFYEIMWKNIVEPARAQMTIWRMRIACWITKATGKLTIYNTYLFSTATMVARTHLNITSSRHTTSDGTRENIWKDRTYSVR